MPFAGTLKIGMLVASVSRQAGGMFNSVRGLAQALHQPPSISVRVFGIDDPYTTADLGHWHPVPLSVYPRRGPSFWSYSPALGHALHSGDLDLLHTHGLWMYPSVAGRDWGRRHRKPYLIAPRGMLDPWALANSSWKKRLACWLYETPHLQGAACLHALCPAEAQAIRAQGLRAPICIVPNGTALPENTAHDPSALHGIVPEGAKVMLFLGRLHPKKGLPNLLRAWKMARHRGNAAAEEWHLVIVGWDQGNHRAALEALSRDLGITQNCHLLGPRYGADKGRVLAAADAFILPTFSEGLPMAVLEAWSYRLPVLMTEYCNLDAGFAAGAALRIAPREESIAEGLGTLFALADRERAGIGARGRQLVETTFSWRQVAAEMHAVYAWLTGGGTRPGCVIAD